MDAITFQKELTPDGLFRYIYMESFATVQFFRGDKLIEKVQEITTVSQLSECVERWERWIKELKTPLPIRNEVSNSELQFI
jgi:hypothetical protein